MLAARSRSATPSASVSTSGTVFSDERTTLQMALTAGSGAEGSAKAFSWGLGTLLGVAFKSKMDGMSIPHRVAALAPRCVAYFFAAHARARENPQKRFFSPV